MTIPYWHVDAFADRPFTGNQAAVMELDAWRDDVVLQAIAAENMFAETAFIVPDASGATDWELRWFTPAIEVRLCGHATLATGHVLLGRDPARAVVRLRTRRAGVLEVRRSGAPFEYEVALPAIATEPGEFPEAAADLGGRAQEIWRSSDGYSAFFYASEDEVRALQPDFRALALLGDELLIATAPGRETDIVSRAFAPGAGIDEDPVTGSAHAVLAPLWAAKLGRDHLTAFQASARGGHLACRVEGDRVWLGGDCRTVVKGQFIL
jgi:predicted PhzF superfamily epimerase YddE/YHI9